MFDCIIIGGGPAGVSTAINLKLNNKFFLWFGRANGSKKTERAELVRNYVGLPDITGAQLAQAFSSHAKSMDISPDDRVVTAIYPMGNGYTVQAENDMFEAKTLALCTGVEVFRPIEGEENFVGRGVSYCATCDGFLYKGKTIGILCTEPKFEPEAQFLLSLAAHAVVCAPYKNCALQGENFTLKSSLPQSLSGAMRVQSMNFKDESVPVDGVFILKGAFAPNTLLPKLKVENGHIVVDRHMQTSQKGVFAAGDCTGRPYQFAKAVGEGNVAAHAVIEYLAQN